MTVATSTVRAAATAVTLLLLSIAGMAQPAPPVLRTMTLNGGATTAPSDRVTLVFAYDHPAAPGQPIPFYRIRKKGPDTPFPNWDPYVENLRGTNQLTVILNRRNGVDGIMGPHTIELQIRDAAGQESNVLSATITRVPPPMPPAQYTVTGNQVGALLVLAEQRNYKWFVTPKNGNSRCERHDSGYPYAMQAGVALVVLAKVPAPGGLTTAEPRPECQFRFLQNKPLQAGWRLLRVGLHECPVRHCELSLGGQAGGFTVVKKVPFAFDFDPAQPPGSAVGTRQPLYRFADHVVVTEVVLEGPAGRAWQDAFRP